MIYIKKFYKNNKIYMKEGIKKSCHKTYKKIKNIKETTSKIMKI